MKRVALLLLAATSISGCANIRAQQAVQDWKAANVQCNADHPKVVGHYVERASCLNDALSMMVDTVQAGAGEAAGNFENLRYQLAKQVDAGRLSQSDYEEQAKAAFLAFKGQASQEADQEQAERAQSAAAILAAMPQPQYVAARPYVLPSTPAPTTTNCMAVGGGMVSCQTY